MLEEEIILGVCQFCAKAFHVANELGALHAVFLGEYEGHHNMGKYAAAGYDLVTL